MEEHAQSWTAITQAQHRVRACAEPFIDRTAGGENGGAYLLHQFFQGPECRITLFFWCSRGPTRSTPPSSGVLSTFGMLFAAFLAHRVHDRV